MSDREVYYYEQKNVFGRWQPYLIHGRKPSAKTSEGRKIALRNVALLPEEYRGLKFPVLQALAAAKAGPFAEAASC
ncbi:MAG: hypothetical protein AAFR68_16630 [Pseudomonadota bacterium]